MSATTYEWLGEPHASASVKKVDGVEVARNSGIPIGPNTMQGIYADYEYLAPGEAEVMVTTSTSSATLPRIQRVSLSHAVTPIDPGQAYALAVKVKHERSLPVRIRSWLLNSAGSNAGIFMSLSVVGTEYQKAVISGTIPEDAAYLGVQVMVDSSTDEHGGSVEGDLFWAKDYHVALAPTETEALAQVEQYFDGDTPTHSTTGFKVWLDGEWRLVPTLVCKDGQFQHASIKKYADGAYRSP